MAQAIEQHQAGDAHEQAQVVLIAFAHLGQPGSARRQPDVLFLQTLTVACGGRWLILSLPLVDLVAHFRLHTRHLDSRFGASEDIQPVTRRLVEQRILSVHDGLGGERHPEIGRIGLQGGAEESRRSDAHQGEWRAVDHHGGPDNRRVAAEMLLPGAIAHHGYRRGAAGVIGRCDQAAGKGPQAE